MAKSSALSDIDPWATFVSGAVAFAAIYIVLFAIGVDISSDLAMWMFFGFIAIGLVVKNTTDFTVGFALTTVAIIVALTTLLPRWVSEPFDPLIDAFEGWLNIEIGAIDPLGFGVIAIVFTFLMIVARVRLTGKKKKARTTIEVALRDMALYVRTYMTVGRLVILFASTSIVIALQQSAQVLGIVGGVVADVPLVASNAVTAAIGYMSLGGELPFIGSIPPFNDLTAAGFAVVAIIAIAIAAGIKWDGSGPIAQFLRNRGL